MSELKLKIVHRPGPLNIMADALSRIPDREISRLSEGDLATATQWLAKVAPHCPAQDCAVAAYDALLAGRKIGYITCKHCSAAHLDSGEWAAKRHTIHTCASCGKNWQDLDVSGNPLAVFNPKVHGHQLKLERQPSVQERQPSVQVATMVVEPSWLGAVAQGQQDANDSEMASIREKAQGNDSRFVVR